MITDPNDLNNGIEVIFNTTNKTIQLVETGNLDDSGVTLQALYSFIRIEWKSDSELIKHIMPIYAVASNQYEFLHGWKLYDTATRSLIRVAGWDEFNASGSSVSGFMGVVSLGDLDTSAQPYYQQTDGGPIVNTYYTGPVNESIQIFGDIDHGNIMYNDFFKIYVREQGKTYDQSSIDDINVSTIDYRSYTFPLSHRDDLKISASDNTIENNSPYTGINITYYDTPQQRMIDGVNYDFSIIIDGNGASLQQIYEKIQYLLRQNSNINSVGDPVIGATTDLLLKYVGETLETSTGVYIDNAPVAELSNLHVYDNTGTLRLFPISVVLTLNNLQAGSLVSIYDNEIVDYGNNNTLLDSINSSLTSFSYTHGGATNDIVITISKIGYEELRLEHTLNSTNQTININQEIDFN